MSKKGWLILGSVLIVTLIAALAGAGVAFAQEPTPTAEPGTTAPQGGPGPGRGGRGRGGFGGGGFFLDGGQWVAFDAAAEALGLTPEELFAELHGGKSLEEVAEEQGVDPQVVYDAIDAARTEAQREHIEQAVEDGTLTQEQADRMLKRQGQAPPMGEGGGPGGGFRHGGGPRDGCTYPGEGE